MASLDETIVTIVRDIRMARRRTELAMSELERQRAVCAFPISVVRAAKDMRELIELVEQFGHTEASKDTLEYLESLIREEYRKQFGREML